MEVKMKNPNIYSGQVPPYDTFIFKEKSTAYCLLIPIFNEGKRFQSQIKKMRDNGIFDLIDVIVCDAGSKDGSTEYGFLKNEGFTALLVRSGIGRYSTDLRMGYSWALDMGYEGCITVDGNDKDDTSAIPMFIEKLNEGYDYIQGSRYIKGGRAINTPFIRHWAIKLIMVPLMSISARKYLTDSSNGFRAYSKRFLIDKRVLVFRDSFNLHELIYYLPPRACRLGYNVVEIPVTRAYPDNGEVPSHASMSVNIATLVVIIKGLYGGLNPKKADLVGQYKVQNNLGDE
jgi:dolichol-phosphate mannosyltransferase